uniref:Uncharacterized protein n=1 Tax=Avena sativa TaxID=4498 RepID=A0ACD5WIU7_AVESA
MPPTTSPSDQHHNAANMANEPGAAGHPIRRLVEASTICFSEEPAPAGRFEVLVACFAKRSFEYWKRGDQAPKDKKVHNHSAGGTTSAFSIGNMAALQSADTCRGTLRRMLALLPQLRALRLTEAEWDAVVPGDVIPVLVNAVLRGDGFTFSFTLEVQLRVIHDERALLMASKEWLASTASGERDCRSVSMDWSKRAPPCCQAARTRSTAGAFPTGSPRRRRAPSAGPTSGCLLCRCSLNGPIWGRIVQFLSRFLFQKYCKVVLSRRSLFLSS